MKKLLTLCSFIFFFASLTTAQTTTVTATVTDADNQPFIGGTFRATFTPPPGGIQQNQYKINGSSFTYELTGVMDSSGILSVVLTDDRLVNPSGGKWGFTVCSATSVPTCFYSLQDVFGASINLSSQISANIPAIRGSSFTFPNFYTDAEVSNLPPGGSYYNIATGTLRYFNALTSSWTNIGTSSSCTGCAIVQGTPSAAQIALFVDSITIKGITGFTVDNNANMTAATVTTTGSGPSLTTVESASHTGVALSDVLDADSTLHCWIASFNNDTFECIARKTGTWTAGHYLIANSNTAGDISDGGVPFNPAVPGAIGGTTPAAGAFTTISATSPITSTQATGSAPFVVASTTNVANLNASSLNGATMASPGAIGNTTPAAGKFTNVNYTSAIQNNGVVLIGQAAPTISSGFGSSPTISIANGTASFRINVGTGAAASQGIVGLPTATTGWNCFVNDLTASAAHVAYNTVQLSSTTTTATVENQTKSTGAAVAWGASDIIELSCHGN